jgi:thioredoxin 2
MRGLRRAALCVAAYLVVCLAGLVRAEEIHYDASVVEITESNVAEKLSAGTWCVCGWRVSGVVAEGVGGVGARGRRCEGCCRVLDFYAPYCGHCKALAPKYGRVSSEQGGGRDGLWFGAVDATKNGALADAFGVRGYPTLFVVSAYGNGSAASAAGGALGALVGRAVRWEGTPSVPALGRLARRLRSSGVEGTWGRVESARELERVVREDSGGQEATFALCPGASDGLRAATAASVVRAWRHAATFVDASQLAGEAQLAACAGGVARLEADADSAGGVARSAEQLAAMVEDERLVRLAKLDGESALTLRSVGKLLALAAVNPKDPVPTQAFLQAMKKLAAPAGDPAALLPAHVRARFQFAHVDAIEFRDYVSKHGVADDKDLPALVVLDMARRGVFFAPPPDAKLGGLPALRDFLVSVVQGDVQARGANWLDFYVLTPLADLLQRLGWVGYVLSGLVGLLFALLSLVFCCGTEAFTALFSSVPSSEDLDKAEAELQKQAEVQARQEDAALRRRKHAKD